MLIHMTKLAPSGRMYYRHPSGMGSVMIYYDDPKFRYLRRTLVLDAKYRSNQRFGCCGIESENRWLRRNLALFNQCQTFLSDKRLINNYPRDPQSSKENCDNWMKLNSVKDEWFSDCGYVGVPAVSYCRSIFVDGVPCDLPNIQILMRIYCDKETIDDLDPTIEKRSIYALSEKYNPYGRWTLGKLGYNGFHTSGQYAWSSTNFNLNECYSIDCFGFFSDYFKFCEYAVIPVLEL